MKTGCVYILTNYTKSTLYVGVTSDLIGRMWKHKAKFYLHSFSAKYNVCYLVYYEVCDDIVTAIWREKQIKNLVRRKKLLLIESQNPEWKDLSDEL